MAQPDGLQAVALPAEKKPFARVSASIATRPTPCGHSGEFALSWYQFLLRGSLRGQLGRSQQQAVICS